jgi:hypothetical protein
VAHPLKTAPIREDGLAIIHWVAARRAGMITSARSSRRPAVEAVEVTSMAARVRSGSKKADVLPSDRHRSRGPRGRPCRGPSQIQVRFEFHPFSAPPGESRGERERGMRQEKILKVSWTPATRGGSNGSEAGVQESWKSEPRDAGRALWGFGSAGRWILPLRLRLGFCELAPTGVLIRSDSVVGR